MLKKAGAVAALAAGVMMVGSPAFAGEPEHDWHGHHDGHHGNHHFNQGHIVSLLNGNNVNAVVGLCNNDIPIIGLIVPIASPETTGNCAAGGISDGHDNNVGG
ncbi:hypothetical protein [Saccharothrix obliqua]|uniref:hypothetical protein n=1 Tax=Saccharothrix obliqua TaxID=2861747 RepID=UPI001C5EC79C|nr:hypothetical protein [Saccharothrix obliqua]MBW4719200.1 hypothetical protein [Saccharothrix obliqua]